MMMYPANMATRPVQISLDEELLRRIDADPETQREGRSAFLRAAARVYLRAKERRQTDAAILKAYEGAADELLFEAEDLMAVQEWPRK
jgi:metal-responsive CopG/Arc/MetJ family transcriptional regulator